MVDAQRWACVAPRRVVCGAAETACALCAVAGAQSETEISVSESSFVRYGSNQLYRTVKRTSRRAPTK
eukprot:5935546-Prymnesium_polylepis.1